MTTTLNIFCASLIALILYTYLFYPILIDLLSQLIPKKWIQDERYLPSISILLPAYNEESVIEKCLNSLLAMDYPPHLFQIIIASDGSTDRTNEIIKQYSNVNSAVIPLCFSERRGKMLVVNDLAKAGKGDILFFTDADVTLSPNSLKMHVRNFADPSVGGVAGSSIVRSSNQNAIFAEEKKLVLHDNGLRESESKIHSTIAMFGGNYSIRKELWKPMPSALVYDDVYVVLSLIMQGFRVIFEPESIAIDEHSRTLKNEFKRKARNASFGFSTIKYFPEIIGFRKGIISIMLWSHKILRWITPGIIGVIGLLVTISYFSGDDMFWQILFFGQCSILLAATIGGIAYWRGKALLGVTQIFWFLSMQVAFMSGIFRFLTNTELQTWSQPPRATSLSASKIIK